jgi:hypothetical protein
MMQSKLRKWVTLGACALIPGAFAGDLSQQDILSRIEQMQKQIEQQQQAIQVLKSQLEQQQEETQAAFAQAKTTAGVTLGDAIDGLKITGDLRIRNQYDKVELENTDVLGNDEYTRDRWRSRLRLGMVWTNSTENFEIGVGLATAMAGQTTNSSNYTWSTLNEFDYDAIAVDYAYAKHTWDCFSLSLGQTKNPYESSWILWDGDLRPQGVTAEYATAGLFATAGYYVAFQADRNGFNEQEDAAEMGAVQVGYKADMEGMEAMIAAAYYYFDDQYTDDVLGPMVPLANDPSNFTYEIADLYGYIAGSFEDVGVKAYGEILKNFGSDGDAFVKGGDDDDLAWVLGLEAKFMGFTLGYGYGVREAQSAPMGLVDQDFGVGLGSVNVQGHQVKACYAMSKNLSLGATVYFVEYEDAGAYNEDDDDAQTWQFDVSYKF